MSKICHTQHLCQLRVLSKLHFLQHECPDIVAESVSVELVRLEVELVLDPGGQSVVDGLVKLNEDPQGQGWTQHLKLHQLIQTLLKRGSKGRVSVELIWHPERLCNRSLNLEISWSLLIDSMAKISSVLHHCLKSDVRAICYLTCFYNENAVVYSTLTHNKHLRQELRQYTKTIWHYDILNGMIKSG